MFRIFCRVKILANGIRFSLNVVILLRKIQYANSATIPIDFFTSIFCNKGEEITGISLICQSVELKKFMFIIILRELIGIICSKMVIVIPDKVIIISNA